jgi:AAA domain
VIRDRSEELGTFHAQHFAKPMGERMGSTNGHHSELTDEKIISLARNAKNAAKLETLWEGDTSGYASYSEADQALISLLAFYTQDENQLDSLYRQSALCREKWLKRSDYRRSTIDKALSGLTETYTPSDDGARMVVGNGQASLPSPSPSLYKDEGRGRKLEAVRFSDMKVPGPRRYLLKDLVLAAYVTLLYGDGGVAKSLLALALAVAIAEDSKEWLGREVEGCSVLYMDFELDSEEQARRVYQLCRGQGLDTPPEDLLYMSALGHPAREAFTAALEACIEHSVGLMVVDSLGPALQGDAEAARDVIGFFQKSIEPFRAKGIAILIIDHQSRLQQGQSYQSKGAFGSVFKTNLARSVIHAQATERGEGALTVRLRQKKHNFGPLAEPFGVKLSFTEEAVSLEAVELDASELAEEATLNATDRVKLALENGPAYPWEIVEHTGLALKTVKNVLTGLRKQGVVEPTGEVENRTEQVRLSVPASLYRDRDAGTIAVFTRSERSSSLPTSSWAMEREELDGVEISRGESVEHDLNRLIERRHDHRTAEERHRPSEELWQESVERYNAERDRQLKTEWAEYHQGQAERHRAVLKGLIAHHEEQAAKLMDVQPEGAA